MHEILLQFIWQYSLYLPGRLRTTMGEQVTVIHPGRRNTDSGPDFLAAKVKVGDTLLVGNVELHVYSKDWFRHGHQRDPAYRNIILHVVYRDDAPVSGLPFSVMELAEHIPHYVIRQYTELLQTHRQIPCGGSLPGVRQITRESLLSRLLAERWEQKLADWDVLLKRSSGDWRQLLYWRMAANFGFRTNATPFLLLAQSLPLNILTRHRTSLPQLEALLFGQAGMLEGDIEEGYPAGLQSEYRYLRKKYGLMPLTAYLWKFMRMRPANFPTVRIAQFAALVNRSVHLFTQILERSAVEDISKLLDVTASEYWDTHFRFGEFNKHAVKKRLGEASVYNILINTIAPIQFLFAYHHGHKTQQELAVRLLESVPPEQNHIISLWEDTGWKPANAAHSQAMLQLFHEYCSPRRCLECSIGLDIIRTGSAFI